MIFSKKTLLMLSVSPFLYSVPTFLNSNEIISRKLTDLQGSTKSTSNLSLSDIRQKDQNEIANLSKFDGRDLGIVTEPKNQGNSNLCWAYTLSSLAETNLLYKGIGNYTKDNLEIDARKLDGVVNIRTADADKLGLTTQDTFKRTTNTANDVFERGQILLQQNGLNLTTTDKNNITQVGLVDAVLNVKNDVSSIKNAIAKYGSVSLEYKAGWGNNSYNYYAINTYFDHASVIVGWDDNYSKDNFTSGLGTKPTRNGAWIVKNSWGKDYYNYDKDKDKFGNNKNGGYFYLSYDSKFRNVVALDVVDKSTYDNFYYYDGMAGFASTQDVKDNAPVSVIFPVKKANSSNKEILKGITIGVIGSDVKLNVKVYQNVKANNVDRFSDYNNPESGTLSYVKDFDVSQKSDEQGNYTLNFDQEIGLSPNTYFSIVVTPTSGKLAFSSENKSTNDLSFYKDGNKWINTAGGNDTAVATIKALTKDESITTSSNNNINYGNLDVKTTSLQYTGKDLVNYAISFNLTIDNKELKENTEYLVSKAILWNDKETKDGIIGTYHLELKGTGDYTGNVDYFIPITKGELTFNLSNAWTMDNNIPTITVEDSYEKQFNTSQDIKLPDNWDYVIPTEYLFGGKNKIQIKYNGEDAKYYQQTTRTVIINKATSQTIDINQTSISLEKESYLYDGNPITPSVSISYKNKQLVENQDYQVVYSNNVDATNDASITITGLNYFTGSISKTFTIEKVENKINSFEIKDGVPVIDANYGNDNVIYHYFEDKDCTKRLDEKPTKIGNYYIQAIIPATQNYPESKSSVLEFNITSNQEPSDQESNNINTQNNSKSNLLPVIITTPIVIGLIAIALSTFFIIKKLKNSSSKN